MWRNWVLQSKLYATSCFGIILILAFCFAAFAQIDNNIPPIIDPDSFYKLSWKDEKAQLDSFFIELVNHKETEGLIVLEFDKKILLTSE